MIGSRLGPYEITAKLGEGGMGEVYRATDSKLKREVALKVLPAQLAGDSERLERFLREAQAVAALNHPNIVTLFSFEENGGVCFLTMELVEGAALDQLIPREGFELESWLEIGAAIADAVAAAHAKGIVHRDLKPANIMIGGSSDRRQVKVLDFGLARMTETGAEAPANAETLLTREGVVMGTLPYMSPEQVRGAPLDERTDLFSLGVILYEMAAGRRPFHGESSVELGSAILRDPPQPLSGGNEKLPADVDRILGRCLEKAPRDRIASARALYDELRLLRREVAAAVREPAKPAAAVAIAVLPFADMSPGHDQEYLCEGMAEEIMSALVRIDGLRVAARTSAFRAQREGGDPRTVGERLGVGLILEGSVRTAGSRIRATAQLIDVASGFQLWSERYDRDAADVFAVQDEIAAGVVEAVKSRLAPGERSVRTRTQAVNLEAYRAYLRGRYLRHTKNDHGGALRAYEEAAQLDPTYAPAWVGVAECTVLASFYGLVGVRDACAHANAALATAKELEGESTEALYVRGFIGYLERDWVKWESAYRRALEREPANVVVLGSFSLVLVARHRIEEALALCERARAADPLAAFPYAISGVGLAAARRFAEADRMFEDAFAFESENMLALWGAGTARFALGRHEEAIATLDRAVAKSRRGPFFVALLGWSLAAAGRTEGARALADELAARKATEPAIVPEAWLLAALGETDAAFALLARAEAERQAFLLLTGLPGFDPMRADPRFRAMEERLGLNAWALSG